MTPPPDATLVARLLPPAITSERRALHAEEIVGIFNRLRNPLLRYLIAFGISAYEGEEIIQEAFLALFRHLQGGKSRANLQGWLASKSQVCGTDSRAENWQVPEELKQAVFAEYGLQDAPRDQYEVDFLITPELGDRPASAIYGPNRTSVAPGTPTSRTPWKIASTSWCARALSTSPPRSVKSPRTGWMPIKNMSLQTGLCDGNGFGWAQKRIIPRHHLPRFQPVLERKSRP